MGWEEREHEKEKAKAKVRNMEAREDLIKVVSEHKLAAIITVLSDKTIAILLILCFTATLMYRLRHNIW